VQPRLTDTRFAARARYPRVATAGCALGEKMVTSRDDALDAEPAVRPADSCVISALRLVFGNEFDQSLLHPARCRVLRDHALNHSSARRFRSCTVRDLSNTRVPRANAIVRHTRTHFMDCGFMDSDWKGPGSGFPTSREDRPAIPYHFYPRNSRPPKNCLKS